MRNVHPHRLLLGSSRSHRGTCNHTVTSSPPHFQIPSHAFLTRPFPSAFSTQIDRHKTKKDELSSLQSTIPPCHENSAGLLSWDRMMRLPLWPTSNFTINSKNPQHNFTRPLLLINQMGTHLHRCTAQVVFGNKVTKHHHKGSQQKHGLCMGHSLTFYNIHIQS